MDNKARIVHQHELAVIAAAKAWNAYRYVDHATPQEGEAARREYLRLRAAEQLLWDELYNPQQRLFK